MKTMKRLLALVLIATFLSLQIHPAVLADDSDIFGANIQPNVLILLDNVGQHGRRDHVGAVCRRDHVHRHQPVRELQELALREPRRVQERLSNNATRSTPTPSPTSTRRAAQTALSTVGYWSGRIGGSNVDLFAGNYLNYQLGFCASGTCTERKIDIAKQVLTNLVDTVTGVRFGFMKFWGNGSQGSGGGSMVAQMGTSATTMKTAHRRRQP